MDKNTERYMVEELQEELERKDSENAELREQMRQKEVEIERLRRQLA